MRIDRNTKIYLGQREIVKIKKGNVVIWESQSTPPVVEPDYFYIQNISDSSGQLTLTTTVTGNPSSGNYATTVEYSTDKENWTTLNLSSGTTHTINVNIGEKVYFRNDSGKWNYWTGDDDVTDSVINSFSFEYHFNAGGNINTLLNYNSPNTAALSTGCFAYLFTNDTSLVLAKYLTLPATTLAPHCYRSMFNGCTNLVYGPQLPATTMAEGCYRFMFYNCSSMHYAPALPATTLATKCYHTMFYGCSRITEAPTLSVTTLAPYCYDSMFQYCTALEAAPALPATTLTPYCYYEMFRGCSSLEVAPTLPAQTLAQNCYQGMFKYCSSLNIVTTFANNVSAADCITDWLLDVAPTGIVHNLGTATYTANSVSGIPTGWIEDGYFYMENISQNDTNLNLYVADSNDGATDCTTTLEYSRDKSTWTTLDLSTAGSHYLTFNAGEKIYFRNDNGKFNQTINHTRTISFNSSENNATGGNVLTLGNYRDIENFEMTETGMFQNIFSGNYKLIDASHLVISRTSPYSHQYMFNDCQSLVYPPILSAMKLYENCYNYIFNNCLSLTSAPALPATTLASGCYKGMFYSCIALTTAPELPAIKLENSCYGYMFENCTNLINPPSILPGSFEQDSNNTYWYCYEYMFKNCQNLGNAPVLPQTKLGNFCYSHMFDGCLRLTTAPALPATTLVQGCYEFMFYNCQRLVVAPELPATTLADVCYQHMFDGCLRLEQVITYANDISAADCITDWLLEVNQSGTFYNLGTATYTQDSSGIPQEWTEDTTAPVYADYIVFPNTYTIKSWMDGAAIKSSIYGFQNGIGEYVPVGVTEAKGYIGKNTGNTSRTVNLNVQDSQNRYYDVTVNQTANDTDEPNYFYIENLGEEQVTIFSIDNISSTTPDKSKLTKTLEYSFDKDTWTTITFNWVYRQINVPSISIPVNGKVYFRNDTNKFSTVDSNTKFGCVQFTPETVSGKSYGVGGDLRTLLNYRNVENAIPTTDGTFGRMFECSSTSLPMTALREVDKLIFPKDITSKCYFKMFFGCSALETVPEKLPAKDLIGSGSCYESMFEGCSNITTTPILPAKRVSSYAYSCMFKGCQSLCSAPVLPATYIQNDSYESMFENSGLLVAPELPALELGSSCYSNMFSNCYHLINIPETLPATTLAGSCYKYMFRGCTSITTAPALPATTIALYCYQYMFSGCQNLTNPPALPATTMATYCYQYMFQNCTSLVTAPALPATTLAPNCYDSMFYGCTSLVTAPILPATTLTNYCYKYMFNGCTSLNSVTSYAQNISATSCLNNWLGNVASEGTFNNFGFTTYPSGASGIPSGWTEVTPTITSITASPSTYELKSYQKKVTANSTLTLVTNMGTITMYDTQTITVGENTGDSTRTLTETIPYKSSSYQITIVQTANDPVPAPYWSVSSTGTYPFQLNENNYYESTNKGHDNTYSYATLSYFGYDEIVLECINSGENNYDYGIISQPDQTLSESISDDGSTGSTVVFHNFKGESSTSPVTLTIPSDGNEHFITIKFRKDSSSSQGNDSLQFKVVEPTT